MKKIVSFIVFATLMGGGLSAQDTLSLVKEYCSYRVSDYEDKDHARCFGLGPQVADTNDGAEFAKMFTVEGTDTLLVYGVAAALTTRIDLYGVPGSPTHPYWELYNSTYDKTLNDCYEYLRLYKRSANMLVWTDQVRVHRRLDVPAYYVRATSCIPEERNKRIPVYEQFFDNPVPVTDTFYVGMTQRTWWMLYTDSTGVLWSWKQIGFDIMSYTMRRLTQDAPVVYFPEEGKFKLGNVWRNSGYSEHYLCIYPILTPPDTADTPVDTTVIPVDTTTAGVSGVDMVGRYVSVSPNPAGDRATVLSSFGLTAIEAYDPQGRQLYAAPATGLRTTLDVSAWPRGTVLLHIHTPAGTAVKKLLLR